MRRRDLDPIEPGLGRQRRDPRVPVHDRLDLLPGQRPRLDVEAEARDRGRREGGLARRTGDLLPTAVKELDEQTRAVPLNGLGDAREAGERFLPVAGERVRRRAGPDGSTAVGLEDDQPRAAASASLVVGDEVLGRKVLVDERRLVGRRDDPVLKLDRADA